jgi:hypothetical protein
MQKLPDFVSAFSHHLKPLLRDRAQFTCMLFHPAVDGRITLDSAVQSKQFRSPGHGVFTATSRFQGATLSSYSIGSPKPSVWTPSWRRASKAINRRCALNVMICVKTPPNVKSRPARRARRQTCHPMRNGFGRRPKYDAVQHRPFEPLQHGFWRTLRFGRTVHIHFGPGERVGPNFFSVDNVF